MLWREQEQASLVQLSETAITVRVRARSSQESLLAAVSTKQRQIFN